MPSGSIELPQGTLDLLILRTLSLEPLHGWGVSERIQQISSDVLRVQQGSLIPHFIAWSAAVGLKPNGVRRRTIAGRSITSSPEPDGGSSRLNEKPGRSWQQL